MKVRVCVCVYLQLKFVFFPQLLDFLLMLQIVLLYILLLASTAR